MAVEAQPEQAQGSGGGEPGARPLRPWWRRPAIHTALIGAVVGFFIGHWLGNFLGSNYQQLALNDSDDLPLVFGYLLAIVGWMAGLGVFNDILRQMTGRPRWTRCTRRPAAWPSTSGTRLTTRSSASSTWLA